MEDNKITMKVNVDVSELEEVQMKLEKFNHLLREANSLVDELADKNILLTIGAR